MNKSLSLYIYIDIFIRASDDVPIVSCSSRHTLGGSRKDSSCGALGHGHELHGHRQGLHGHVHGFPAQPMYSMSKPRDLQGLSFRPLPGRQPPEGPRVFLN